MGRWYYLNASLEKVGPISSQALKKLAENGAIHQLTTLISEDGDKMYEAGGIEGLFPEDDQFHSGIHERAIPLLVAPPKKSSPPPSSPAASSPLDASAYTPWDSSAGVPVAPSAQTVPMPPPVPSIWSSGIQFPTALESVGTPIAQAPSPARKRSVGFFVGIRPEFLLILIFLSVLIKITRIVVAVSPTITPDVAVLAEGNNVSRFFSEDLTLEAPAEAPAAVVVDAAKPQNPGVNHTPKASPAPILPPEPMQPVSQRNFTPLPAVKNPGAKSTWFDEKEWDGRPIPEEPSIPVDSDETDEKQTPPSPEAPGMFGEAEPPQRKKAVDDVDRNVPPAPRKESRSTEEIIAEVEGSIALISGKSSGGSGFVVLPGIVATNSHVIGTEDVHDLEITFPSESGTKKGPFKPKLLYEDPERDLAFLEIPTQEHVVIPTVRDYRFRRGQKVIAIGNPGRGDGKVLENAVCEGILSTQTEVDGQPYYQLSIAINHGNSGGPVLDDTGSVLGVATLKATKTEAIAYCIPPDALNSAVASVRQSDPRKVHQYTQQHVSLLSLNRGLEKMAAIVRLPEEVLNNPPEKIRELAKSGVADFDEAILRLPSDIRAFVGRAILKAVLDDLSGAIADIDLAVRIAPERKELLTTRESFRQEMERRRQLAGGRSRVPLHPLSMDDMNRLRPGGRPQGMEETEESTEQKKERYRQVLAKEEWTFQGKPLYGKIVGYSDGIVRLQPKGAAEGAKPVERYANRFSPEDIEDIRFYAYYHGIPFENPRKR